MHAFEVSRFGYWISPSGEIVSLETPQSHAAIIIKKAVFPDDVFEPQSEAVDRAVAFGWIGISIAPVGLSVSVRVRDASVDIRAVRAFQELVGACGWRDLLLYTEHQSGTGEELTSALRRGAFDSKRYETYESHVEALKAKLVDLHLSRAQHVALRDFLEAPVETSTQEVSAHLRHARKACDDAIMSIKTYSFRNISKLDTALAYAGDLHAAFLYQQRLIDERLSLVKCEFFDSFKLPDYQDPLVTFEDCAPEVAVRDLQLAIEDVKKSEFEVRGEIKILEGGEKALAFLTRLLVTRSSLGLVKHHMERFADDLKQADLTTEKVIRITQYYIAHECARTYSTNSWKPFGEMLEALREFSMSIKRQPVMGI
jgi:hypothetical protein